MIALEVAAAAGARVERVSDEHVPALAAFYREVWDAQASAARVRGARSRAAATNPHGAGVDVPTFIFLDGERVVGHVTTIPIRLLLAGRTLDAHWLKGLMVLPEYRNGPVGFHVLREALRHVSTGLAAVVASDARRLFGALGFRDLGVLANRVRLLSPDRVIGKLAAGAGGVVPRRMQRALRLATLPLLDAVAASSVAGVLGAWTGLRGCTRVGGWFLPELPDTRDLDRLWLAASKDLRTASIRDAAHLHLHYGPEEGYRWIGVMEGAQLRAFGALRPARPQGDPRLNGVRMATLSDVVANPNDTTALLALLRTAEQGARALDADALLCSATHPALLRAMKRRAYLKYPGNVHILLRAADRDVEDAGPLEQWWLTRGDSAADEVF